MAFLARVYLEAKGITLGPGEVYDANKIAKGLSKVYQEAGKDQNLAAARIRVGGKYFDSKKLDWTPEAVWRRWEDIKKWSEAGESKDISERRKL